MFSRLLIVSTAFVSLVGTAPVSSAAGGTIPVPEKLHASDGTPADAFGSDVAIRGDVAVVAARHADSDAGAAYVFRRSPAGAWVQEQKLITSGATNELSFGMVVATDGSVIAIGRPSWTWDPLSGLQGTAYVFRRNALGYWQEEAKLAGSRQFGFSVAVEGNTLFVGDPANAHDGLNAGAVNVFRFEASLAKWSAHQVLLPGAGSDGAGFGRVISLDGAAFAVDALAASGPDTVRVYRRGVNDLWAQEFVIDSPAVPAVGFGANALSLAGDRLAVSAVGPFLNPFDDSVFIFERNAQGSWIQQAQIVPTPTPSLGGFFGLSLALSDDRLSVFSPIGGVYVFEVQPNGQWNQAFALTAPQGSSGFSFGESHGMDKDVLIVGDSSDGDLGLSAGAAFAYDFDPFPFAPVGFGCPGTGGVVPQLAMSGAPTSGGHLQVDIANGVGSGTTLLAVGLGAGSVSMGYGCMLNVAPVPLVMLGPLPLFPLGAQGPGAGSISFGATLPLALPQVAIGVQAFVVDAGIAHGFSNTNGVVFTIQ